MDRVTIQGLVATTPRNIVTQDGLPITTFRLAASQRRFDRAQQRWIESDTNWYTITSFNKLAENVNRSICKGERVILTGKLIIRDWDNGERAGTTVEVECDGIGHDLTWGTSTFIRQVLVADREPADEVSA